MEQNRELEELYLADGAEHKAAPRVGTPEYAAMRQRDKGRRLRVEEILKADREWSARDLYHAAWILNHGDEPAEALRAHELSVQAAAAGLQEALWLSAASFDRWRMYSGLPQRFGTQIVPDGTRYRVWPTDPTTTDEERAALGVPRLIDQVRRAEESSRTEPQPPMNEAPKWLKEAIERWGKEWKT